MKKATVRIVLDIEGEPSNTWVAQSGPVARIYDHEGPHADVAQAACEALAWFLRSVLREQDIVDSHILGSAPARPPP